MRVGVVPGATNQRGLLVWCAPSKVDLIITEHPLMVRALDVLVTSTALADTNPTGYRPEDVSF